MATISDWYLVKRGKNYSYGFRIDGKTILKTCKTSDKAKAEQAAKAAWAIAKREASQDGFNPLTATASECFQVYKERRIADKDPKDLRIFDNYTERFHDHFKKDPVLYSISKFQAEDFRDWLLKQTVGCAKRKTNAWKTERTLSVKTVKNILQTVGAVYRYHGIQPNPFQGIKQPKLSKDEAMKRAIRFYSPDEEKKIFDAAKGNTFELPLKILWHSGLRPAELLYLKNDPQHINRDAMTVTVIDKKQDIRTLDLANNEYTLKAWNALIEWIDEKEIKQGAKVFPYAMNWANNRWKGILSEAKLPPVMLHQIRHQFVKYCFHVLGWDLTTISQWCGHRTDMAYKTYSRVFLQSPKSNNSEETTIISPSKKTGENVSKLSSSQFQFIIEGKLKHEGRYVDTITISKTDWDKYISKAYEWGK